MPKDPDASQTDTAPLSDRPWLHVWAMLVVVFIFILVAVGGNVTSLGAGLAVPDGFYTFGYWTPLAPLKKWAYEAGTFWEHSHRLQGYVVGLPALALMGWLWVREVWLAKRRGEQPRRWLAATGTGLVLLGLGQALMGIFRVDWLSTTLAFVHGIVGQLILALAVLIAAATSATWLRLARDPAQRDRRVGRGFRLAAGGLLAVLVVQLILGAAVRHNGATLAIPDFPTNYGHVLPPGSSEELAQAWQERRAELPSTRLKPEPATCGTNDADASTTTGAAKESGVAPSSGGSARVPYTLMQVHLHFAHRVIAFVLLGWGLVLALALSWKAPDRAELRMPRIALAMLLAVQVALGVMVIWGEGYPALATAHQATGAVLLAVATWLALRVYLTSGRPNRLPRSEPHAAGSETTSPPSRSAPERTPESAPGNVPA